ncbi:MAG: hypothetical protein DRQ44_02915 [Gammaproteobacteria bacterium]|nr:MAG: hypothetical protein DRQ44_02915 [Gammaproteobacteria bacterium]
MMKSRCLVIGFLMLVSGSLAAVTDSAGTELKLKESPRLWVSQETVHHLSDKLHTPYLQSQARRIIEDADWLVDIRPIAEGEGKAYQYGTRAIASHLQCLTAAWVLTHEAKYRAAAIRHMGNLMTWTHISCEARPTTPADTELPFCLSYGEHAADIGFMYDVFRPDITPEEQQVFFDVLDRFYLKEALKCLEQPPWWANQSWSNWNGVCCGGMGILALAFYDDRPEVRNLIPFVEKSLGEYFKSYIENGGGCHEGTGYWNYGMHYAMRYLLSWENATGLKHPAFEIQELGMSLNFPLDFTGITFGDNDGWGPTGMYFMLAKRLNNPDAALRAATYLPEQVAAAPQERERLSRMATGDILYAADFIPSTKEMEELRKTHMQKREPVARIYKGLGWAALADDSAFPTLRLSARGGSSEITGHGHLDLLSFICMVNGERMIDTQRDHGYISTTFSGRGHEIYSRSAASKSTLFVDGLGCRENAVCEETEVERDDDLLGIRIDGSNIFLVRWKNDFIGRHFLMVENRYWLVIDAAPGHIMESRFHTYAECTRGTDWLSLKSGKEQMMMTFASLGEGEMQESLGMPASPQEQTRIFRWMSPGGQDNLHVTALNPGNEKLGLELSKASDGGFAIKVSGASGYQRTIRLTAELKLKK